MLAVALTIGTGAGRLWGSRAAPLWSGFVYPNRGDLTDHRRLGAYPTLAACRAAAVTYLADLQGATVAMRGAGRDMEGDYECGRNCRPSEFGLQVCEETTR